jgi:hypothetical protein
MAATRSSVLSESLPAPIAALTSEASSNPRHVLEALALLHRAQHSRSLNWQAGLGSCGRFGNGRMSFGCLGRSGSISRPSALRELAWSNLCAGKRLRHVAVLSGISDFGSGGHLGNGRMSFGCLGRSGSTSRPSTLRRLAWSPLCVGNSSAMSHSSRPPQKITRSPEVRTHGGFFRSVKPSALDFLSTCTCKVIGCPHLRLAQLARAERVRGNWRLSRAVNHRGRLCALWMCKAPTRANFRERCK